MKAVGLAELLSQGVDHAHRFREVATARESEMDEDMRRGCNGPGAATFRHPAASLPGRSSEASRRTRQTVMPWPYQTGYR
jgi:hypothetical protein